MRDCIECRYANLLYPGAVEAEAAGAGAPISGGGEGAAQEIGEPHSEGEAERKRRIAATLAELPNRLQAFDALLFALDMALDGLTHEAERNALGCLVSRLQADFDGIRRERDRLVGDLGEVR